MLVNTGEQTEALENKLHVIGIFLDLTKAYDVLNHQMLLDKLDSYGIRGIANQWFQSYLSNRTQFVEVTHLGKKYTQNKYLSSLRKNSRGAPQGSILGPILFLLYINDLPKYVQDVPMVLYADDINILVDKDENTLTCKIAYLMNHLEAWFNNNELI
jgi:hypothetical protein